ncbi:(d)CMP kinase [Tumidithrix elongata RA019]|uniref:(d)CMP kinase n=1 Tax=Tumidithrix elongata BACA0141 TaxID=2716417 RepID=A0AAW9PXT4_9CYAN|nr:(d)CMP kinase [Tumidithrix elongata RA019]
MSPNRKPIIAIDGPAGAGKSTVAKLVAQELGLLYLDTGAMYRGIAWVVQTANVALTDDRAIAELARQADIDLRPHATDAKQLLQVFVNGVDVTTAIRSKDVTSKVSAIAAQPMVREILVSQQQALGKSGGIVMEGRDIGTHVFPDAEIKVFLTASVQERAKRRHAELVAQSMGLSNGEPVEDITVIAEAIQTRDDLDTTRTVSPLRKADDAITVDTDGRSINDVVTVIVDLYIAKVTSSNPTQKQ